ncbi:M20/M25/M40 family metallo-hydrolase [Candidatus Marimicrobium litorale]|nr:M20/M25/M40 family metallo-hydrolase [Candidatus Marimicrobium litorale]
MNKCCSIFFIQLCLASGAHAESAVTAEMARTAEHLIEQAQKDNMAYELVQSLTTEIGPRLAGTSAEARARNWAINKLELLGFENVHVESFEVPVWLRGRERARIVSPFPQPLRITALGGSTSTGEHGVEGEVVGFPSLDSLIEADPARVEGKIVFVDEVMARKRDGSGYGVAVQKRLRTAYVAQQLGAIAALIRSVGTSSHRFPHTGQMRPLSDSAGKRGVPMAALSAPDADQLSRVLSYGGPVVVHLLVTSEVRAPAQSGNVIAEIRGRDSPEEIVLAGAHLDSWDLGTGAVDDGAGVGIVIAASRLLLEHLPEAPRRTIRLVLFGSEEVGFVGARDYSERYSAELPQHIVAAESDFGAGDIWRFDTRFPAEQLPYATEIARILSPLDIVRGNNTAYGGPDLRYMRESGVPVITLLQDGTDYFDLHHTPDDTLDKIGPDDLHQNVAAWAAFLYLAAETEVYFRDAEAASVTGTP